MATSPSASPGVEPASTPCTHGSGVRQRLFQDALETMRYWHITHTNLAIVNDELGFELKSREHHDRAVEYDTFSGTARSFR